MITETLLHILYNTHPKIILSRYYDVKDSDRIIEFKFAVEDALGTPHVGVISIIRKDLRDEIQSA